MTQGRPRIAIVGGTGALGSALAKRWIQADYCVFIGSRDVAKAEQVARALQASERTEPARGMLNRDAARQGDIVVVTVPYASQTAILEDIKAEVHGKIVLDTTVPLVPPRVARVQLPPQGSAALVAREVLGENVSLVSGFHNVAAHKLQADEPVACDVLLFGDDVNARDAVAQLVAAAGLRAIHGGPLQNSVAAEAMTSVLININRRYKVEGAGIRITAIPGDEPIP